MSGEEPAAGAATAPSGVGSAAGPPGGSALEQVAVTPLDPDRFREVLDTDALSAFEYTVRRGRELLGSRTFWNVNSTARGGGVAEMLRSLIGYARGAGLDARWAVIAGDNEFFAITKRLHNHLHGHAGDGGELGPAERAAYERRCAANAALLLDLIGPSDVVLLHDPQTAGMIPPLVDRGVPVLWRAHVGADEPNELAREAWRFLLPYVQLAEAYIFSREAYLWEGLEPTKMTVIAPSIDAFSPKNQSLSFTGVTALLRAAGLAADGRHDVRAVFARLDGSVSRVSARANVVEEAQLRLDVPLMAQISRWDRLKDPLGVMKAFAEHVSDREEPHLVLAGPDVTAVADDPEGAEVFAEVEAAWTRLPRNVRTRIHLALLPMVDPDENAVIVNALQRRSDVIVQKSLAEGFGLTVAEAMWKGRPVVASHVGGIREQIEDGRTGFLVEAHDLAALGTRVSALLEDAYAAERIGDAAQMRVREQFLGPRHLGQYVELLESVLGEPS